MEMKIEIDAEKGTINVNLSNDEINKRKSNWKHRELNFGSGTLWKYAQNVGDATNGAVTHPGGSKEKNLRRYLMKVLPVIICEELAQGFLKRVKTIYQNNL